MNKSEALIRKPPGRIARQVYLSHSTLSGAGSNTVGKSY